MVEYGWTFAQVYTHTLYQLNNLYLACKLRQGKKNQLMSDILRMAPNAEKADYEKFRQSLIPVVNGNRPEPVVRDIPGFAVKKNAL